MKKIIMAAGLMMAAFAPVFVFAADEQAPAVQAPVEVGNKICPVSGEKVGEMGDIVKVEHKGKMYNLCCGMCTLDFNKDPDKYTAIADKEVGGGS